ncbi:hypothetical protein J6590_005115 [Homalodisca vitripennis]|nr:hypothetical protein J6590_005115 [Homalodisca vitripennis]
MAMTGADIVTELELFHFHNKLICIGRNMLEINYNTARKNNNTRCLVMFCFVVRSKTTTSADVPLEFGSYSQIHRISARRIYATSA